MKPNKYTLAITVFVCGAIIMIYELVGSRVLGPYFGTSIFIWTSLIGIILGSLSLGYYLGGRIADKRPSFGSLSLIIFLSSIFIGLTILIKDPLLLSLQTNFANIKIASVIAALILFLPTSVLLGMVSPYAAKLRITNLDTSGATIGNLYAISTAGSIFGTFLAGFFLIPHFGTNNLLIIQAATLLLVSILLSTNHRLKIKLSIFIIIAALSLTCNFPEQKGLVDVDTAYNRIWIYDHPDQQTDQTVKTISINGENHSSMFLKSDELVNEYTKYYHLAEHFNPDFNKTLMFGGAGYSFPKDFLLKYAEATIDVVEIDPAITELAKKYFRLKDDPRLAIFHEDGRTYLNRTREKYDVIFGDAFSSQYSIPYQLTTREALQKQYDILNDRGIVILNIISAIEGDKGLFLRAEYATYKNIFPQVYLFPVNNPAAGAAMQNIILIALKSTEKPNLSSADPDLDKFLKHFWPGAINSDMPILTDDFAPVDYYMSKTI